MLMNCVKRIPSYLRGIVDVFVTSECIHLYISYYISLYVDIDVFPSIKRVINIIKSCKFIEFKPPLYVGAVFPIIELRLTLLVDRSGKVPTVEGN